MSIDDHFILPGVWAHEIDDFTVYGEILDGDAESGIESNLRQKDQSAMQVSSVGFEAVASLKEHPYHATITGKGQTIQPRLFSFSCTLPVGSTESQGRVLACRCYGGRQWSISFRHLGQKKSGEPYIRGRRLRGTGYKPSLKTGTFLNSISHQCEILGPLIFDEKDLKKKKVAEPSGLVVVTGATGTAKSQIIRGLIHRYLKVLWERDGKGSDNKVRRRHLVTFEDPIERSWCSDRHVYKPGFIDQAAREGIDYTPRERGKDAACLEDVLMDALRQKPSALYVGETRDPADWAKLLDFAATGHLAFTTSHAGSLVEAMSGVLKALKAETPAARSSIADRIVGIVHLRQEIVGDYKVVLPALWRRKSGGSYSLMSDGLASLVPGRPATGHSACSLGRTYFADRLFSLSDLHPLVNINVKAAMLKKAAELDLGGV